MASFVKTCILLLTAAASLVTAQDPPPFGCQSGPFQCGLCGFPFDTPIQCLAVNATFDDVPANQPLTNYSSASWPGFTSSRPSAQAAVPHLAPFSVPQTAVATSGKGSLVLGTTAFLGISQGQFNDGPKGALSSFHYGCAAPLTPAASPVQVPTACFVSVTENCAVFGPDASGIYVPVSYGTVNNVYTFTPATPKAGNNTSPLAFATFPGVITRQISDQTCFTQNYTFETTGTGAAARGPKPALVLDDVIFRAQYARF